MKRAVVFFCALSFAAGAPACGDKTPVDPADTPDAGQRPDAGGNTEQRLSVTTTVIDGLGEEAPNVGDNAQLSLTADGRAAIAYGSIPQASTKYEIWYAERANDGTWTKEQVVVPGHLVAGATGQIVGLGLAHVGGNAHVVYLGGDDDAMPLTPYPTDLAMSVRRNGTWNEEILRDMSNEVACDCPNTQDTCNFGNMVGVHAAISATRDGSAYTVVYRDQHGGFARDDLIAKADVEVISTAPAAGANACVDPVRSGGEFGNVTHTLSGRPVVAYNLVSEAPPVPRVGVWAGAFDGSTWRLNRVSESRAGSKIAMTTQASGRVWLAFSHADDVKLVASYSDDEGLTWSAPETVDDDGKTGLHPSMTVDAMDRVVIAYGYCGRRSDDECPGRLIGRSEVKMARLENGSWQRYKVDDGQGYGFVGLFNSVIAFPDGTLGISFVDDRNGDLVFAKER